MRRKVSLSLKTANEIMALREEATSRGLRKQFRHAWAIIWDALNHRPLPTEDSDTAFGEIRYHTKFSPRHAVCIGGEAPLAVRFAVCEEETLEAGEPVILVTILKIELLS